MWMLLLEILIESNAALSYSKILVPITAAYDLCIVLLTASFRIK